MCDVSYEIVWMSRVKENIIELVWKTNYLVYQSKELGFV
jgi:hypothetical protein